MFKRLGSGLKNKWLVRLLLCLFLLVTLFVVFNNSKIASSDDIQISTRLLDNDVETGDKVYLDITVTNNSSKPIYNLELLTETPDKNYGKILGNDTCKVLEELGPSEEGYLRATYGKLEEETAVSKYSIKRQNIFVLSLLCLVYVCVFILLIKSSSDKKWVNVLLLMLGVLFSLGFVWMLGNLNKSNRDDKLIYSYEDIVEVKIGEKSKKIRVLVNYTDRSMEDLVDKNKNDAPDVGEKQDIKRDSDGDGISDYFELYLCGTNPYMIDTFGSGLGDVSFDIDKDGISNQEEIELGSNPLNKDTDYDGLEDSIELELGTELLDWDTDKDGMSDGFEVEQGYDPLVFNEKVKVVKENEVGKEGGRDRVKARAEVVATGEVAESLEIDEYKTMLVNEDVPGYIVSAFDFSLDGKFEEAEISFEIDNYWVNNKKVEPCIYYFNEETQLLEEVESVIEGDIVKARVEHFSVYVVLNRLEVNEWLYEDIFYQDLSEGVDIVNIGFVVDISHSMEEIDPNNLSNKYIKNFVDSLTKSNIGKCNVSLTTFAKEGNLVCDFTDDYSKFLASLSGIQRDTGDTKNSGTDIQAGILSNLQCFLGLPLARTYDVLVLVTDGDLQRAGINIEMLLIELRKYNVRLYCIDIGDNVDTELKKLSLKSGGCYYYGKDLKIQASKELLTKLCRDVQDISKSYVFGGLGREDLNMIDSNLLRTGTGLKLFESMDLSCFEQEEDIDGDGLVNGEEISIKVSDTGFVYYYVYSDPFRKDTDGDGLSDKEDDAPFVYGLQGGIVGQIYLVAETNGVGHCWLVLHNEVNKTFTNLGVRAGYMPIKYKGQLRFIKSHNWIPYTLQSDSYISFGHYPKEGKVVWDDNIEYQDIADLLNYLDTLDIREREAIAEKYEDGLNSDFRFNQEFYNVMGNINYSNAIAISKNITNNDLDTYLYYTDELGNYSIFNHCTHAAINGWNLMTRKNRANLVKYNYLYTTPKGLYSILERLDIHIDDFDKVLNGYLYDIKPLFVIDEEGRVVE